MTVSMALIVLVLSLLIAAWGITALAKRSRAAREPSPSRAMNWESPLWNVAGVVAGVIGAIVGIIGLFK